LDELGALNVEVLLAPLLARLDQIAVQLDAGLTVTFDAFEELQAALPSAGGGSSVSVSVDVGIG